MKFLKGERNDFKEFFNRLWRRDFSGNTGIAIKNSIYQFSTSIVGKIGSLTFTIIIARLLMPELFGLYSLALSTIIIFSSFADLGIGQTLIMTLSKEFSKRKGNPKGYYLYIRKLKFFLTITLSLLLASSSYFIAKYYYQKPIFLALLAGSLYLIIISYLNFISYTLQSQNRFKPNFYKEIIFQITRLILIPLVILLILNRSEDVLLFWIIFSISMTYLISSIYLYHKNISLYGERINLKEKRKINSLVLILSTTTISGLLFGYIDIIILGRFVDSSIIGYYQAAISLAASTWSLVSFSAVLFPLFSRMDKDKLKHALSKSVKITFFVSTCATLLLFIFSKLIVLLIYGENYLLSINILRILVILIMIDPLIGIYSSFHISNGNHAFLSKSLLLSTLLNIVLNLIFINILVSYSAYLAAFGVAIATIISRGIYLAILIIKK